MDDKCLIFEAYQNGRSDAFDEAIEYFEEHANEVFNHISARDFICDILEKFKEGWDEE